MNDPPLVLDAEAVAARLAGIDVRSLMRGLFRALAEGRAAQPPQTLTPFPGGGGDFITYLGVLEDAGVFGAKLSPYLARPEGGLVTAWTLLMSMATGRPLLLCDALRLTTERTAATSALAVELLAAQDARRLAVIGAGPVGAAHVRQALPLRPWSEIRVHSPRLAADPVRAAALRALDARLAIAATVEAAALDADVILLCTSSGTAVLDPRTLRRPALITSVSGNVDNAHEVPPATLPAMDVYCDYRATAPLSAGEMRLAAAAGWSTAAIAGDLPELVTGRARPRDAARHAFFRSTGLGLEDVAIAHAILTRPAS